MSRPIGLRVLKAKLRGFHASGTTIANHISKSEKERKNRLWDEKRSLGNHCRYHLVAYGLLRGVPYDRIERCAPDNQLNPERLLAVIQEHNGWDPRFPNRKFDLERVKRELLVTPATSSVTAVSAVPVLPQPQPVPTTPLLASNTSTPPTSPTKPTLLGTVSRLLEKVL